MDVNPLTLERFVGPDEPILGWCFASPMVLEPAALTSGHGVLAAVTDAALRERDWRRHRRGPRGSLARLIPSDRGWYLVIALTATRCSVWDFGVSQREMPTTAVASFPRTMLRSVTRFGTSDQFGIDTRFRFADGSFIDLKVMEHPELDGFWAQVA